MLRSVVVGTGFMGEVHTRAVRRAGGVVAGVVARRAEAAADAGARWGAEAHGTDLATLIEQVDADLVHVCTPNALHEAQVLLALEAGLHVICEKPLATSVEAAARMLTAAQRAGVVHAVPFAYRFYGSVRELRARAAGGAAGRITLVHGHYLQDWLADPEATNWRADPAAGGPSRAFADIGVHWCDLAEFVTGQRIVELAAVTSSVHDRGGGEDLAAVLFRLSDGAAGTMQVSQVSHGRANRLELYVDAEHASFGFEQQFPDQLWLGEPGGARRLERGADFAAAAATRFDRVPAGHPQGYQDCFDALVADVYAAVGGQDPDGLPTFADGHRAAVLTEAVLASAAAQTWIAV